MLFFTEFVSLPFDLNTFLCGAGFAVGAAGLGLASVFTHERTEEEIDVSTIKNRIAELEKVSARTLEQNDELASLYSAWAVVLFDEAGDLDEISRLFAKAEAILQAALTHGDDAEIRQQLGTVYLNWAVVLNDCDEIESAVGHYLKGVEVLKPLDDSGNGEAKYDTAGMKLNLGIAYHELGEFEKAKTVLGESFLAYRAVEKIGFADTRYYMAKVSVEQGHVLSDMEEPLAAIVDAYNRAMRLLVEVIEDQQRTDYEQDLANALLDRCVAVYEDWINREFATNEERNKTIDDALLDVSRGVELLEKQFKEGNDLARFDLFHGLVFQGKVLCDTEKYKEAKVVLDRVTKDFADLCEGDEMFLMQMSMAYACRAVVQMGLGNKEASQQDCQKGSELISKLLQSGDSDDEEIQDLKEQFQILLEQLK